MDVRIDRENVSTQRKDENTGSGLRPHSLHRCKIINHFFICSALQEPQVKFPRVPSNNFKNLLDSSSLLVFQAADLNGFGYIPRRSVCDLLP